MKNPIISPVDLLIYCPTKPGVKAWTLFYLFYYLKVVLVPSYLNTHAIAKVLSYFRAKQTSPICQLFCLPASPWEDINHNDNQP